MKKCKKWVSAGRTVACHCVVLTAPGRGGCGDEHHRDHGDHGAGAYDINTIVAGIEVDTAAQRDAARGHQDQRGQGGQ